MKKIKYVLMTMTILMLFWKGGPGYDLAVQAAPAYIFLNVTYEGEYTSAESVEWARSISGGVFEAADAESCVKAIYYTTEVALADDMESMTMCSPGEPVQLLPDTTYYFRAKDHAGNVSEIMQHTTRKLDTKAPVLTIKDDSKEIEDGAVVYLNQSALSEGRKAYLVDVTDEDAGWDSVQAAEKEFIPSDVDISETTVLTTTVRDYVGNEATHSFTVVYDVDKPVISNVIVTDGIRESESGILTNQNVTVRAFVEDANLKEVILVNMENTDEKIPLNPSEEGEYTHFCTISADTYMKGTYQITACDLAGNETLGNEICVEIDRVPPTITAQYPDCDGTGEGRKYYRPDAGESSETVELIFTETNFKDSKDAAGNPVKPDIRIYKNGTEESNPSAYTVWEIHSDDQIAAKISLPYGTEEEIEYRIMAAYQDAAGNRLIWEGKDDFFGSVTDAEGFQSGILVLDNKAPELTAYSVSGESDKTTEDGTPIFTNKGTTGDVQISFALLDSEAYWNPSAVILKVINLSEDKEAAVIIGDSQDISWQEEGDFHVGSYKFTGEPDTRAKYAVQISYSDRAGNTLILNRENPIQSGKLDNGTYTSDAVILDHVAPVMEICFNEAFRLVDGSNGDYPGEEKTPVSGMTSYYGKAQERIELTVKIIEDGLITDIGNINGIADFVFRVNGVPKAMDWKKKGDVYTGTYVITEEGDHTIDIFYEDAADNKMIQGNTVQGGDVTNGRYVSPVLVLDKTAPAINTEYTDTPVNTDRAAGRKYFDSSVNLEITIDDQNIRYGELKEIISNLTALDHEGTAVENRAENFIAGIDGGRLHRPANADYSGPWTVTIPLSTEANYDIPVGFTDLAGNTAEYCRILRSCTDTTAPEKLNLSWSVSDSGFMDAVNYKELGFLFADSKLTIHADTTDKTAGVHVIRFTVTDEKGKKRELEKSFDPAVSASYEAVLPLETEDFKGTVTAEVFDWSANKKEEARGYMVESSKKHSSTGSAVITTKTSPSRTVDGKDFYNKDVTFNLTLKDTFSGLRSYRYTGGRTLSGAKNYAKQAGTDFGKIPTDAITYQYSADMTLDASENNENDIKVSASYMDNAGHVGSVEQLYHIDITKPTITVEYDLNDPVNQQFYSQKRTATVTIRERNFHADDVDLIITNTEGVLPEIGEWSESGSGDDTKHVCHVTFSADGDYTFTVAFEDMAGNRADYERVDEFTIDQTRPVLTVTYDNDQSVHEYYYAQGRTATIDILEHNFDPDLVDVAITAEGAKVPSVSGWSRHGDHNTATVTFGEDADYTFDISGVDQANNPLEDYEMDHFIVDRTPPKLEIFDIEDMSANHGIIMPGIRCYDTNYDAERTVIQMKGCRNHVQKINGKTTRTANGLEMRLNDFEYIPEMDDLYTIEAAVYDLAGNSSEARVTFSVNRFGSVYTFDDATDRLVGNHGKYYTDREQDIVIVETNADTLEFREITCNLDGDLRTLTEGEDFTVSMSGSEASWKQYTYTIDKKNFEKEGTYILTVYSEDRASNTSDNNTKGRKVEFAVDKTSPSILISGVEDNGQYRENRREVTLDVQDNIQLEKVEVIVDGIETVYSASHVADAGGKLVLTLDNADHWQIMRVKAYDMAGNEETSEEIKFLLTSNIFIQLFMNKTVFCSIIGILLLTAAGVWRFLTEIE